MENVASEAVRGAFFASEGANPAVELLAARPGELILDVGCGDGSLTARIIESGARVVGLDACETMVEAARSRGVDAFVAGTHALDLERQAERWGQFDAVFSNAALHWIVDPDAVASGIFRILKDGGRFVGEMGGAGNLAVLRSGIGEEFAERGYPAPAEDPHWFPSCEQFVRLYCHAGFTDVRVQRIDVPTELPDGIRGWVHAWRSGLFDAAMVPEWERAEMAAEIEARLASELRRPDGVFFADHVRLRFSMRKPA